MKLTIGLLLDIIIFIFGCILLLGTATKKLNIHRQLIVSGLGLMLLSILSFLFFPGLRIVEIIFISIFLIYQLCNLLVHLAGKKSACPHAICVPGAQVRNYAVSLTFQRRLGLALNLYHKYHENPYIAVCGGKGSDEIVSEAQAGSEYLITNGVAPEKIIREDASHTTFESFVNLSRLLPEKNSTVLIATSSYAVLRAALLAKKVGLNAKAIGCREPFLIYMSYSLREIAATIYNLLRTLL